MIKLNFTVYSHYMKILSPRATLCLVCSSLLLTSPVLAQPSSVLSCFQGASRYHRVDTGVLRAISLRENSRCDSTISDNKNASKDFGCMQINSVHFQELSKYGVYPKDLLDQCKNIYVGAWHYRRKINKHGNTWVAVGAYHSETPVLRDKYAQDVYRIWIRRGLNH